MHCASCAGIIEKTFSKIDGVRSASVNYGTETVSLVFRDTSIDPEVLSEKIEPLGYSLIIPDLHHAGDDISRMKDDKKKELAQLRVNVLSMIPLAVVSIFVMGWEIFGQWKIVPLMPDIWMEFFHHLLPIFATYALVVVGKPYLQGLYRFLRHGAANMDTLIGLGTVAAFLYSFIVSAFEESLSKFVNVEYTYYDVTIVVIAFISLGKYLEMRSKERTGDAIEKLLNLQAKTALVMRGGKEEQIPVESVRGGDLVIVKPGGKIPVDGILTEGASYVNESMVTGEPVPALKQIGDTVVSGTTNTDGAFIFSATKVGKETMLARIIAMVEDAQGSKAPIQALADKISSVFVPVVLVLAFIALGSWVFIGAQYLGFAQALSYGLVSFVGILVIACPCALGLATPTAIIVGVGKGAKEGILIKNATALERLGKVDVLVVDKTGTITKGKPEFVSVQNFSAMKDEEVVAILASLESRSEHPIAHAVTLAATEKNLTIPLVSDFLAIKGRGVSGKIDGVEYYAGSVNFISELGLSLDRTSLEKETREGKTPIILATKRDVLGVVMVADIVKRGAKKEISRLHQLGIRVVMLSGDDKNTAAYIAKEVGIDEVFAEVSPEDKLKQIKTLQAEGLVVVMAGDGVNDAPALAQADVGIAMATGTDVAIESAGVTLLHGDISKIVKAINLSKMTMRGIKQNLFWAFIYNIIGIPLASGILYPVFGWLLSPVFAGLAMAFSSVSVVGNSLRLKNKKI